MKSDPYETIRNTAMALESEGHSPDLICDALLTVGLNAGCKIAGPEFVIAYLHRMIATFEAGPERQAPPMRTQ